MDVVFFDGNKVFKDVKVVRTLLHSFSGDLHIICILVCTTTWTFICNLYEKAFTWSLGTIEWSMQLSLRLHLMRPRTYWQSGQVWAGALACLLHPRINTSNCHFARQTDGFTGFTRFIWVFLLLWWAGCSSWLPSVQTIVYPKLSASKVGQMDFPNVC